MSVNLPPPRSGIIRALDGLVNKSEAALGRVQLTATEIKSRELFYRTLEGFKVVGAGAEKIVLTRTNIPNSGTNEPQKCYYIGVSNFLISKGNALKNEFLKMNKMKEKVEDKTHLAIDAKELKGKDTIHGHYTLELEFAEMGTFEGVLRNPETSFKTRMKLGVDLLKGFSELHKINYAYGDLKPENCLIFKDAQGDPYLKVADFGKADEIKKGQTRMHPGNLRFCAPEAKFSQANDVWATAIVLIRNIEEAVLDPSGEPLVAVNNFDDMPAIDKRRGVEKYIVENKAFLGIDEPHFTDKALRRSPRLLNPGDYPAQAQSTLMKGYITALKDKLIEKNKLGPEEAENLANLLIKMTSANPADRGKIDAKLIGEFSAIMDKSQ